MTAYRFTVLDVAAEPYAVAPQLTARLRIEETRGLQVHAMALRCQVRIEPQRRGYASDTLLRALFGSRERWADTLKPFLWMQANATVPGFRHATETDLVLPCTYDLDVVGTKYLHAVEAGDVPLDFLFSGSVFLRGERNFAVEQVPWECESRYAMPVTVWREMIDSYFPNSGWLRADAEVLKELAAYRARHDLISWDETLRRLLEDAS